MYMYYVYVWILIYVYVCGFGACVFAGVLEYVVAVGMCKPYTIHLNLTIDN